MEPLFHPITRQIINDFLARPAHALLITGPRGSGKGFTAQLIAAKLLDIKTDRLTDHPYVKWLRDQEKGISIEDIRTAQTFMQLKVPGKAPIRRVLIIEQGEGMSTEAQNAFLKLLEEPPADSLIMVTVTGLHQVLPTIRSRAQVLQILPPAKDDAITFFSQQGSPAAITKAYYLSEGYPGLMHALLDPASPHPLIDQIDIAKDLLRSTLYERLSKVDALAKQKNVELLLQAMERVCHAALSQAINAGHTNSRRWAARLQAVVTAQQQATTHVQNKLLLTNLMLAL